MASTGTWILRYCLLCSWLIVLNPKMYVFALDENEGLVVG